MDSYSDNGYDDDNLPEIDLPKITDAENTIHSLTLLALSSDE